MICIASDEYVPNQIIVNYKKQTNKKFPTKNFYSNYLWGHSNYETDSRTPHTWFQLTCFLVWEKGTFI